MISTVSPKGGSCEFEESRKSEEEIYFARLYRKFKDNYGNYSESVYIGYWLQADYVYIYMRW